MFQRQDAPARMPRPAGAEDVDGRGWVDLLLFFAANVLFGAGLFAHAFLYNFYLDALGHGEAVMGLAAAALTAGGLAALAPAAILVDRFGGRAAFMVAAVAAALGLAAGALVVRPMALYGAAFAAGAGTATWRVAMGPIVMRLARPSLRERAFSWNVALLVGSGAIWTAASGAVPGWLEAGLGLDRLGGLRGALLLGAAATALAALVFAAVALDRAPRDAAAERPRVGLAIPAGLLVLVALVAVWMTASGMVLPFFNIYFQRAHELPIERIGLLFAVVQAATAVAVFGSGEAAARLGARRVLVAWMLLFAPTLWALAAAGGLGLAVTLYLIQGIVPPATNPLIDQILLERAPADRRGAVSSWRNAATEASGFVGASAGGVLLQASGFGVLFGVAGGIGLVGAAGLALRLRLRG